MAILRGRINTSGLEAVPAEFSDRALSNSKNFPGWPLSFFMDPLAWSKDKASGEIVVSPIIGLTTAYFDNDGAVDYDTFIEDHNGYIKELNVSMFALTDLFFEKRKQEIIDLIDNAIMAQEYEETK